MKLSSKMFASMVTLIAVTVAADALAGVNYNSSKSNSGNKTFQPTTTCPKGQVWDATAKKCVATSSINYNASKSNTGNKVVPASNGTPPTPSPH